MNASSNKAAPLAGLLVAGGRSRRMGRDKAALPTPDGPLWLRTYQLLKHVCEDCAVSVRPGQQLPSSETVKPLCYEDRYTDAGPLAGILTAFDHKSGHAWLVVACDMPLLDQGTLRHLMEHRQPSQLATAYRSNFDGLPEPLCTIYEPAARELLLDRLDNSEHPCPRKFLIQEEPVTLLDLPHPHALENANTPEDLERILALATTPS